MNTRRYWCGLRARFSPTRCGHNSEACAGPQSVTGEAWPLSTLTDSLTISERVRAGYLSQCLRLAAAAGYSTLAEAHSAHTGRPPADSWTLGACLPALIEWLAAGPPSTGPPPAGRPPPNRSWPLLVVLDRAELPHILTEAYPDYPDTLPGLTLTDYREARPGLALTEGRLEASSLEASIGRLYPISGRAWLWRSEASP